VETGKNRIFSALILLQKFMSFLRALLRLPPGLGDAPCVSAKNELAAMTGQTVWQAGASGRRKAQTGYCALRLDLQRLGSQNAAGNKHPPQSIVSGLVPA
jgi:hypothetical protein